MNTENNIVVRKAKNIEEFEILKFYDKYLITAVLHKKNYNWRKSFNNTESGDFAIIAKKNNEILGALGIFPVDVRFSNKKIKAIWHLDSLVSKTARRNGLGLRLVKEGIKDYELILAKGTTNPMYLLRKKAKFKDVPNSDYLVKVCKPRVKFNRLLRSIVEISLYLWAKIIPFPSCQKEKVIPKKGKFLSNNYVLEEKLLKEKVVRLFKNNEYLNWRYVDCPIKKYKIFTYENAGQYGIIILKTSILGGTKKGWIIDLICPKTDNICAFSLINKALLYFDNKGVESIWVFSTLATKRRWFIRYGFCKTGISPRFTYFIKKNNGESILNKKCEWDFCHGDGDIELYS